MGTTALADVRPLIALEPASDCPNRPRVAKAIVRPADPGFRPHSEQNILLNRVC
ncbi:hypothetical protein [Hydrogenovibrio thermophilus]|uniref:hypothetical protein n=1 Tax=Hydrogenovibrio thermophilus TaxID=265883 RepID=UPI000A857222|nr:hypothetical protein [Hydrogenovibrio thermophilus]